MMKSTQSGKPLAPEPLLSRSAAWGLGSLAVVSVLLIVALWYFFLRTGDEGGPEGEVTSLASRTGQSKHSDITPPAGHGTRQRSGVLNQRNSPRTTKQLPATSQDAQQLLSRLLQLLEFGGATPQLTTEQVAEMAELLDQLAAQGESGLPVIRKFLEGGRDVNFGKVAGGEQVGYATLRLAIMDILGQVGGVEAEAVALDSAKATRSPHELAYLGKLLEEIAPNLYREQIVTTGLAMLGNGGNKDLSWQDFTHLFEALQFLGDKRVIPDLVKAIPQWNYYPALALAGLPDGAGIPTLIALAKDPKILALGGGDYVLRILAQVSMQTPSAQTALLDQARIGKIPDTAWQSVASALAGYGVQFGNPVFDHSRSAGNWSTTEISQRIAFIEQLIGVTRDPVGVRALREARDQVAAKLAR